MNTPIRHFRVAHAGLDLLHGTRLKLACSLLLAERMDIRLQPWNGEQADLLVVGGDPSAMAVLQQQARTQGVATLRIVRGATAATGVLPHGASVRDINQELAALLGGTAEVAHQAPARATPQGTPLLLRAMQSADDASLYLLQRGATRVVVDTATRSLALPVGASLSEIVPLLDDLTWSSTPLDRDTFQRQYVYLLPRRHSFEALYFCIARHRPQLLPAFAARYRAIPFLGCCQQRPRQAPGERRAPLTAPRGPSRLTVPDLGRTTIRAGPAGGSRMSGPANTLVFVGGMGAGKTTAVRAISDVEPISTEMPLSEDATADKVETTVALDDSSIELDDGELLHLYGVPGQRYLDFMWPMVCEGALGVIVLVSAGSPDPLATTLELLQEFSRITPDASLAVGITRTDEHPQLLIPTVRDALFAAGFRIPVLRVDARSAAQVTFLVRSLLSHRYADS